MTAADFCRANDWRVGDFYRLPYHPVHLVKLLTRICDGYVMDRYEYGCHGATVIIPPTAVRVLNFAGDPLPANPQPEVTR